MGLSKGSSKELQRVNHACKRLMLLTNAKARCPPRCVLPSGQICRANRTDVSLMIAGQMCPPIRACLSEANA